MEATEVKEIIPILMETRGDDPGIDADHCASDTIPNHRLSAVVPTSVGATVAEREVREQRDQSRGASHFQIYSQRNSGAPTLQHDMTMTANDSLSLTSLLSGIMDQPTYDLGMAEGRAEVESMFMHTTSKNFRDLLNSNVIEQSFKQLVNNITWLTLTSNSKLDR
jgi:hypothetical protein